MNFLDKAIAYFSPRAAVKREGARRVLAAYESAQPSRLRKNAPDNRSGDALTQRAGSRIRGYARQLEQNYDLAESIISTLVDNVIGPNGISLEPIPKNKDGKINKEFAKQIAELRKDWMRKPEVTGELDGVEVERLAFRALCRDGEYFLQHVEGKRADLDHQTRVPYSVELIEADLVPMDKDGKQGENKITQGVERNAWGRPLAYHVLKEHPGDDFFSVYANTTKRVPADKIVHVKIVKRFKQARGVSIFAPIMTRLEDIKDYEESERVAARIAAAMCAYIRKGTHDDYVAPSDGSNGGDRAFKVKPGVIFDNLMPGEDVGTIDSNRPSSLLEGFRDTMTRSAVSAARATFSAVSKKYDGTYSAQRQELVEGYISYQGLTRFFANKHTVPVNNRMIDLAILSGQLKIPAELDLNTLYDCECRGPAMVWIDPDKEEKALDRGERAGRRSTQQSIRERGGNPDQVMDEVQAWREEADNRKIVLSTDPKYDKSVPELIFPDQNQETE
jgi:lambda family phage portal protein